MKTWSWFCAHAKPPQPPEGSHEPGPNGGNFSDGKPTGKATTGSPRETAQRQANSEPREHGEAKNTTSPLPAALTTARVRTAKRARSGTWAGPPAHHWTEPPSEANAETWATAEAGPEPMPTGPKAARQRTSEGGTEPGTADSSAASAPEQHPTTNEAPAAARSDATRTTSAEPDAGRTREPDTATTPGSLNTQHRQ